MPFTNDPRAFKRACRFYKEALADGWEHTPAYPGEPEEQAAILTRKGFTLIILMRDKATGFTGKWEYDTRIEGLGPDRLPIDLPRRYNWTDIKRALRICSNCGANRVKTIQWTWRQRVCLDCHKELHHEEEERKAHQREQWEEAVGMEGVWPPGKKVGRNQGSLGLFEEGRER